MMGTERCYVMATVENFDQNFGPYFFHHPPSRMEVLGELKKEKLLEHEFYLRDFPDTWIFTTTLLWDVTFIKNRGER